MDFLVAFFLIVLANILLLVLKSGSRQVGRATIDERIPPVEVASVPPKEFGVVDPIRLKEKGEMPVFRFVMDRSGGIHQVLRASNDKVWVKSLRSQNIDLVEGDLDQVVDQLLREEGFVAADDLLKAA